MMKKHVVSHFVNGKSATLIEIRVFSQCNPGLL